MINLLSRFRGLPDYSGGWVVERNRTDCLHGSHVLNVATIRRFEVSYKCGVFLPRPVACVLNTASPAPRPNSLKIYFAFRLTNSEMRRKVVLYLICGFARNHS